MASATTNTTDAAPTGTYTYLEFGAVETGSPGPYGWLEVSQRATALGGTMLMGARAYNVNTGRFAQVDPVGGGSANSYDYVSQNPLTKSDLAGTQEGVNCSFGTWSGSCNVYLSEWATRQLVDTLNTVAGVTATCAVIAGIFIKNRIGAGIALACGLVSGITWTASAVIGQIDDYGHNNGIYFHQSYYKQVWWTTSWTYHGWCGGWCGGWWSFDWHYHQAWIPYFGYIWHQ